MPEHSGDRRRVVIAGGGIAGLEATLALADLAGDRARMLVVSRDPDFVLKPLTVEEPFTHQPAVQHELAPALVAIGVEFATGSLEGVDGRRRIATFSELGEVAYDVLVVAVGGRIRPAYTRAETFWSNRTDFPVDELIGRAQASEGSTLALVVPPSTTWSLPLYELALLIRRRSEELECSSLRLRLVTPEPGPLAVFGTTASNAVSELFAARRIELTTDSYVVEEDDGTLRLAPGDGPLEAGAVIALPAIEGPAIDGIPADDHGFVPTDPFGRVPGIEDLYVVGDATAFPVKQGGLATQQADAAAEQIAASLGADVDPQPFTPVLRGQLITGAESLNLAHGLTGGQGEGVASLDYLWWPPQKVAGRYLSAWLGHLPPGDLTPPDLPLDVELSWPAEWHGEPLSYDAEAGQ